MVLHPSKVNSGTVASIPDATLPIPILFVLAASLNDLIGMAQTIPNFRRSTLDD